jgi:hypothetical protein
MTIGRNLPSRRRMIARLSRCQLSRSESGVEIRFPDNCTHCCTSRRCDRTQTRPDRCIAVQKSSRCPLKSARKPRYFARNMKFEFLFQKIVTKQKRWATNPNCRQPSGQSLVVQVSGGALTRTSGVTPSINDKSDHSG